MGRKILSFGARGTTVGCIHLVDRTLLAFMTVLLVQSAISIFLPGTRSQVAEGIDVMIRTSSAAIFGYFLSANFARISSDAGQTPPSPQAHILEMGAGVPETTDVPKAQIGFSADAAQTEMTRTAPGVVSQTPSGKDVPGCQQVKIAAAIGLFCLVILLALRNLVQMGVVSPASESITATITQFRDFISGCVGFLIGSPTHASNPTQL